jgi:hypothetical protein
LALKQPSWWRSASTNPIVAAAVITAFVSLAASWVSLKSAREQRELDKQKAVEQLTYEFVKSEFDFVLQALRASTPEQARENLRFLVDTGIIQRLELKRDLLKYLADHPSQNRPLLPKESK